MVDEERLRAIIEVVDEFSAKLELLFDELEVVERQIERVDGSKIGLNTQPAHEDLSQLQAQMATLQAQGTGRRLATGVGDVSLSEGGASRGANRLAQTERRVTAAATVTEASRNARRLAASLDMNSESAGTLSRMMDSASDTIDSATDNLEDFNLNMSAAHNFVAELIPLLVVLIGALPAVIGGLVALGAAAVGAAAALAGVTGLGALGLVMQDDMEAADILEQVKEDFLDAFRPLAEQLTPLFEDALDGLETFFQALADRGDTLVRFADLARDFGSFLLDYIPGVIQALGEMAIAFRGVFSILGNALQDANLAERLTDFMADILPEFMAFFHLLLNIIYRLANMSKGFLQVTNAILAAVSAVLYLITFGGRLEQQMGALIATTLTIITAMLFWGRGVIAGLISRLVSLGIAVVAQIPKLEAYMVSVASAGGATYFLVGAILALIGVLTLGVGALAIGGITALAKKFGVLGTNIGDATDQLRDFRRLSRGTDGDNPYGFGGSGDTSRGSTGSTAMTNFEINIQGEANPDTLRNQTRNANFRASRTNSTT